MQYRVPALQIQLSSCPWTEAAVHLLSIIGYFGRALLLNSTDCELASHKSMIRVRWGCPKRRFGLLSARNVAVVSVRPGRVGAAIRPLLNLKEKQQIRAWGCDLPAEPKTPYTSIRHTTHTTHHAPHSPHTTHHTPHTTLATTHTTHHTTQDTPHTPHTTPHTLGLTFWTTIGSA